MRRGLRGQRAAAGEDRFRENGVLRRVRAREARADVGDGRHAGVERAAMRLTVDAAREPAHDRAREPRREPPGEVARVLTGVPRADDRDPAAGQLPAHGEKRIEERAHGRIVVDDHHMRFTVEIHARHAVLLSNANARVEKPWLIRENVRWKESVFGEKSFHRRQGKATTYLLTRDATLFDFVE